jgi:hypothetical protein
MRRTTDSEHIRPPECQFFAVETTVPGGTVLDKYVYIPKNKPKKVTDFTQKPLFVFVLFKTSKIIDWLDLQLLGLDSGCLGLFFFFFFF